jgi:hypothetical protein
MTETALDTSALQHVLRRPKGKRSQGTELETCLDRRFRAKTLSLVTDKAGGLVGEWEKTCGPDAKVVFVAWSDRGVIRLISELPTLPPAISRKLSQLGFRDTIDRLVIKLAVASTGKLAISEDPDFWDPADANYFGSDAAVVAVLCRDALGISTLRLKTFLDRA